MTPSGIGALLQGGLPDLSLLPYLVTDPSSVLATSAVISLLALVTALVVRRRRVLTALTGLSLAVVLGMTLVPTGGWRAFAVEPGALRSIMVNLRPHEADLTAWLTAGDGPANVVLFVPLGFFLALLLRAPVRAAVLAVGLSVLVECYQASLTSRVGAFADVVSNGLGALLGAVAAAVVLAVARPLLRPRRVPTGPRVA
jgi:glycopeptide antibiotics resistance protein